MMSTEASILPADVAEMVGDLAIPCDWADNSIHEGDGPARWQVTLVTCVCGRTGIRLICASCKNKALWTLDAAECGACGEVYQPFRRVIRTLEWLA